MPQCLRGPSRRFIGVTGSARIRDFVFIRFSRRDEPERVGVHIDICDGGLNRRHVAIHALTTRRAGAMVRVLLERGRTRPVGHARAVAGHADLRRRQPEFGIIGGAMHIMATETCHAAAIHHALHEIISLHAIFVRRGIRKMREARFAELVLF